MSKKIKVSAYLDEEINEQFQKKYPKCFNRFINRVVSLCLSDSSLFYLIMFGEVKK